jgi:sodium transport system permease protein
MRWSIIFLIFGRELRDQLRDRRTIFMIAVLPLLLYPVLGLAVLQFAGASAPSVGVVGIVGSEYLPATREPLQATDYPPLVVEGRFVPDAGPLQVRFLGPDDRALLEEKQVDVLLTVPPHFRRQLEQGGRPELRLEARPDERSRQTLGRLYEVLSQWKQRLRAVRMQREGLPADFADPFEINEPAREAAAEELAATGLLDLMVRLFPFLLVMWSLAGALYPAVDLCAGEKERGTMETLLISPASREEIVWGKFLTIWVFSAATALLNLASMSLTTSSFSSVLPHDILRPAALFWCVLLALPLSAFFSAVCLAIGAYARSSKEGQYYLMPLFLVTMPLVFLTLAPGVELNPFYSLVPVTGVALLLQRLMTSSLDQVPWLYFVPVLAPVVLYSWLALRWAIAQFNREEVLFREAERLDLRLWLRRLLREKEPLPSAGQALFCFALIVGLRWLTLGAGGGSLVVSTGVTYLAFVTAPPLLMAVLLTTRPRLGLGLRLPSATAVLIAALLAVVLLPPLAQLTESILNQFPRLKELLHWQPLVEALRSPESAGGWWQSLLVFGMMPAICEELAFRGFILNGLRRRLRPASAILLSSFLFALYHMNVFQVLPAFVLGVVLGLLAVRSGSVVPGMVFHLLHNGLLVGVAVLLGDTEESVPLQVLFHPLVIAALSVAAVVVLVLLGSRADWFSREPPASVGASARREGTSG